MKIINNLYISRNDTQNDKIPDFCPALAGCNQMKKGTVKSGNAGIYFTKDDMKMEQSIIISKARFTAALLILMILAIKLNSQSEPTNFAGIEVGSKGVKLCILKTELKENNLAQKIMYDTTINTDFIKFTNSSHDATLSAVLILYRIANQNFNVLAENIFLAISSGVKQTADREDKVENMTQLAASIKSVFGYPNKEVEVVSVYQESIFTHTSIIPKADNMTTIIIDIGSGNIKGGYFISPHVFNIFNILWGTKSTTNAIEKVCDSLCTVDEFSKLLYKKLNQLNEKDIPNAVDKCGITNYDFKILFSGGIAWATATLARPELIKEKNIDLSYSEVEKFHYQLVKNFEKITDGEYSRQFIDEKSNVKKVFNQKSLIGGSGLLLSVMKKFERVNGTKSYGFIKNNKTGWLPGYIMNKVQTRFGEATIAIPK